MKNEMNDFYLTNNCSVVPVGPVHFALEDVDSHWSSHETSVGSGHYHVSVLPILVHRLNGVQLGVGPVYHVALREVNGKGHRLRNPVIEGKC